MQPQSLRRRPGLQVSASRGAEVKLDTLDLVKGDARGGPDPGQACGVRTRLHPDPFQQHRRPAQRPATSWPTSWGQLHHGPQPGALHPAWLEAIGAAPLKLGLDLRGGVHFLMEVDMAERWPSSRSRWCRISAPSCVPRRSVTPACAGSGDQVQVVFRDEADQAKAISHLRRQNPDLVFTGEQKGDDFILLASLGRKPRSRK